MNLTQLIARRMLAKPPTKPASAKAAPKSSIGGPKRPEPAQAATAWPVINALAAQAKSAKEGSAPNNRQNRPGPRVVPTPPRHRSASYNPLRRPEPDIRALVEAFAPPPVTPAPPPPVLRAGFRGSCTAVDANNGRRCKLPHHPEHPEQHRHERGMFHRVAEPGTTSFPLREALDRAAFASVDVAVDHTPSTITKAATPAMRGREQRRAKGIEPRLGSGRRVSAHAGDSTSTGIKSIDTNPNHEAA